MTSHQETPGLGTRVNDPAFRAAFRGAFPFPDFLPLTKNDFPEKLGISALSGATITSIAASRALAYHSDKYIHLLYAPMWAAVQKAFEQYEQNFPTPWAVRRWRERYIQQALNELNQGASQ
jgi:Na+-transporting NADH:ubiquinone oxidoreductase subunit NqrC